MEYGIRKAWRNSKYITLNNPKKIIPPNNTTAIRCASLEPVYLTMLEYGLPMKKLMPRITTTKGITL
jgi:hypothetical protein